MKANLSKLAVYLSRPPGLRIPIFVLVISVGIIGFGLFSSERFFAELDASRSAVEVTSLLSELKSINIELRDLDALEKTFALTGDPVVAQSFTQSCNLLAQHLTQVKSFPSNSQKLDNRLSELIAKITPKITTAKESVAQSALPGSFATSNQQLDQSVNELLSSIIDDETRIAATYSNSLQNDRFTTLFLILIFRSAIAVLLIACLLLVSRYFHEQKAMETLLKGAETKFRAVFDQTFQFSGVLSPLGDLLEFNHTLLGFPAVQSSDVLYKPFWELNWWQQSPQIQNDLRTAIVKAATGHFTRFEGDMLSNSERIILDFSVRPIKDESQRVFMLIIEARDVTRHKLAEEASEERAARLNAIFETAPDGIITLTTDGQIESVNNALCAIFGYQVEELIGQNVQSIMPNFFVDREGQLDLDALKIGERKLFGVGHEIVGIGKNGTKIPIEVALSALRLGDYQILTGIVRDITERKDAQQRLKDFYSNVSHELRTPLTSIRTALSLIEGGTVGPMGPETQPVLQIAQSEADRLIRLINDLLDIRKIEEGKLLLNLVEVDPAQLISKALDSVRNIALETGIELVSDVQSTKALRCDEDRIIQVLSNLLSNAIKYSPPQQKVSVTFAENESKCLFSVMDSGCGISDNQVHKLFGRFEQVSSPNSGQNWQKGGSGLGLFISKTIVEHHGGHIGVDTSYKNGSRFWFDLPTVEAPLLVVD